MVDVDVLNTIDTLNGNGKMNYNLLFSASNELLKPIFSNFDFMGKDVLSVLGSGDQAFHFFKAKVGKLDLFDINKLAIYNMYLRYWNMLLHNEYYLPEDIDNDYILNLLSFVNPSTEDERDAFIYWSSLVKKCKNINGLFIPRSTVVNSKNEIIHKWKIVEGVKNHNFEFYNMDISKPSSLDKKYDYIYVSNIGDYISKNPEAFRVYRDNLFDLLKDDGKIICTNVIKDGACYDEKRIFREKFMCHNMPKVYRYSIFSPEVPGYYYEKVRKG